MGGLRMGERLEFTLSFDLGSAAFDVQGGFGDQISGHEVARILRRLAERLDVQDLVEGDGDGLVDINDNRVGSWKVHLLPPATGFEQ